MVMSMTGFGRGKAESSFFTVNVEVKTVNHRFCEINIRMPRQLLKIEDKIKKKLNEHIRRGRAEVYINIEGEGAITRKLHVDWNLIEDYFQFITELKEKFSINGTVTLADILNRQDLIHIEECESGNEELEELVITAVNDAVLKLVEMRKLEGEVLKKELLDIIARVETHLMELQTHAPMVVQMFKDRVIKRMQEFVNGQLDETRILTEVAIFSEKADINEEITRLRSHIGQFIQALNEKDPIGRKLDFLIQEMNRETNTIGSKANDSTIAKKVVEIKSLLEKLKEQVQNIE
ncbi:YicC/YloC family endoribonuclease [Neobacillus thermocopriae]|uniref:YicC family protein n=1 Tax=Neobacillus thermocopriae TaxID=1215031 RepID=A0A6B3TN64_9BACI|nr:YicC/YloC family endoribonuclease [Neobacillus thermocopriae]MED3624284.1 YicC family protein [Neobacillus thermocopriae]MED3713521.1 YicC family protein [Neobacillus thermocopriae]NEX77631.1 YicC family protein [Neobacillus thermocopriae]